MPHRDRLPRLSPPSARLLLSALALLTGSLGAQAITLGRFQTLSAIGEPLRAEIEIASVGERHAEGLRAQIAPPPVFQQQGMEFNPALEGLTTTIERRTGGQTVIVLQGRRPVQDNFLDLIVETQWATGRLVRNYAVLLGNMAPTTPISATRVASTPSTPSSLDNASLPSRMEHNAQKVPVYRFDTPDERQAHNSTASALQAPAVLGERREPANPPSTSTQTGTLTVAPGQTASGLAMAHLPPSVTLDQMLIAMLRENPQAFIQENVNLVRAGAKLRMPNAEQAQQTTPEQARALVLLQHRAFGDYARHMAQNPLQMGKEEARETGGQVTEKSLQHPGNGTVQDTLKLSKPSSSADSPEARLAAQAQAREASAQVDALQKNVGALNALLSASEASATPTSSVPALESTPRSTWMWVAALAALLGFGLWWRNRRHADEPEFAPSYEDEPVRPPHPGEASGTEPIPAQMASIDLELPSQSTAPLQTTQSETASVDPDTEHAKLELAALLITKGDTPIARSLIESVLTSGSAEHQTRARQMLSQLP